MSETNCRHFNGYKPCGKSEVCDAACPERQLVSTRILIIHLEAIGAVLRSTSLVPAIHRKFPGCHLTWVTQSPAHQLLAHNSLIDRVLTTSQNDMLLLGALEFDIALVVDKSLKAAGVLRQTRADLVFGFSADPRTGAIRPANPEAEELWSLGLSNQKKFFENTKTEARLCHEALVLGHYSRDEYQVVLTLEEKAEVKRRRDLWKLEGRTIVGLNTGCSNLIPHKKLSIEMHRELIQSLERDTRFSFVLLGGSEDTERNQAIGAGLPAIQSSTTQGLRDGLLSVGACDIVVTGDSLGMHMAIALKKWVVAWFGPTCAHEIDLFDRGTKVLSPAECAPCWKRTCSKSPMCFDLVRPGDIIDGIEHGFKELTNDIAIDSDHSDSLSR